MRDVTLPQDEDHALGSKTTLETEASVVQSKFVVQTMWINIPTCARVNCYLNWGS